MAYSDEFKAEALATLAANDDNVAATARLLKMPESTLRNWKNNEHVNESTARICEDKKKVLADRLEEVARELVDAMPTKIAEATLQQVATSLGITVDKMQILRGEPTAINEERSDAKERLARLLSRHLEPADDSGDSE